MSTTKKNELRDRMPQTAAVVAERRAEYGNAFVTQAVRDGMAGVPGAFYAFEAGLEAGTMCDAWREDVGQAVAAAAGLGGCAVVVMRKPVVGVAA